MSLRMLDGEDLATVSARLFENIEDEIAKVLPDPSKQEMEVATRMVLQLIALACADALKDG